MARNNEGVACFEELNVYPAAWDSSLRSEHCFINKAGISSLVLKNLGSNPDLAKAWNLQISHSELLSSYNLIFEYFTEIPVYL
jgi:hypothetical protein